MSKKAQFDFITDIDADITSLGEKGSEPLVIDTPLVTVDNKGIARNQQGQFIEGTTNPRDAVKKIKLKEMQKMIEKKTGPHCERIIQKLAEIALYDPEMPMMDKDKETGEWVTRKRRYHFYNSTTQMQAITLLLAYFYGRPTEKQEVDKQVDVRIDKRVADITQLINQNKERLKVIK